MSNITELSRAKSVQQALLNAGVFEERQWLVSPDTFALDEKLVGKIDRLGRSLLNFNKAVNLLYRKSIAGEEPKWVAEWLDIGKPAGLIEMQRSRAFKSDLPRVIRPDILLTENGLCITELDSVPGAIGLTACMQESYSALGGEVIGGSLGMLNGFGEIFGSAKNVHIIVSKESDSYRAEMEWLSRRIDPKRFEVRNTSFDGFQEGDAIYRFFELYDLNNVENSQKIFNLAKDKQIQLTPPPKAIFEEKMLFALFWNKNLSEFWRRELGEKIQRDLKEMIPYTWVVDPAPIPPHTAIPRLEITSWEQLKNLSQRERELILKVSGFSELAWGARGVYLGSDLSKADWSAAVDLAISQYPKSPYVLQNFHKPKLYETNYLNRQNDSIVPLSGRVRLCPYFFISGDNEKMESKLGGILATICAADKKIIHGMKDAILTVCSQQ